MSSMLTCRKLLCCFLRHFRSWARIVLDPEGVGGLRPKRGIEWAWLRREEERGQEIRPPRQQWCSAHSRQPVSVPRMARNPQGREEG